MTTTTAAQSIQIREARDPAAASAAALLWAAYADPSQPRRTEMSDDLLVALEAGRPVALAEVQSSNGIVGLSRLCSYVDATRVHDAFIDFALGTRPTSPAAA